jgi:hypothetical protein
MADTNRGWFYNPGARSKAEFRDALTAAMADLDIALLPFLGVRTGLVIHCQFFLPRPRIGLRGTGLSIYSRICALYPDNKDTDNMLKYFMDALARVIYGNNCLVNVAATQAYPGTNTALLGGPRRRGLTRRGA